VFANITEQYDTLLKPKGELLNGYLALVEAVLGTEADVSSVSPWSERIRRVSG